MTAGRPLEPRAGRALALDIGGTRIRLGVINAAAQLEGDLVVDDVPFDDRGVADVTALAERVAGHAATADARFGALPVGLSLCGNVAERSGVSTLSANLGWVDVPIRDILRVRLGRPVRVATDVHLSALAELLWGAGRGIANFAWVTVGTGYGTSLVLDGRPYRGDHGYAGNLGHSRLGTTGERDRPCGCGRTGCVETLVAGPGIALSGEMAVQAGRGGRLAAVAAAGPVTAGAVLDAAATGDAVAEEVVAGVVTAMASSLAAAVNLLDLSLLIFGGGVITAAPWLLARLDAELRAGLMTVEARTDLRLATESFPDSALWGAAALALGLSD